MNSMKRTWKAVERANSAKRSASSSVKPRIATALTLIGWTSGCAARASRPRSTCGRASRRVISKNLSRCSESIETLTRSTPASTSAAASRSSRYPLVVTERSFSPSSADSIDTSRGKSRRTSGSPPVRRRSPTPIDTNSRTRRWTSSKVRIAERSSHGSPSAGMQYWQRKLQRSVTETRRSPIRLPCPSKSGSRTSIKGEAGSALVDRHVLALALARVDLARTRDLAALGRDHLEPLGHPAGCARNREHHREHLDRDVQCLVDQARVEVDVRVELALGEVVVVERALLQLDRDVELRVHARDLEDLLDVLLDDPGARVEVLVHAVAEAHQLLLAVLHGLEEVRDVLGGADPVEHLQHGLVRAAVQRAVESADAGRTGGVGIHLRRADVANRARRAVLLVIGVQDPEHVERALDARVRLVLDLGHPVHHREEVAGVGEVVVRIDVGQAEVVAVGERRERRHLGDHPDGRHVALLVLLDVLRARVEGRQRAHRRLQHPHRVRVVAEAVEELLDVLVDVRVDRDLVYPRVELVAVRQLAVDDQVGDLEIGRLLAELLDRVAAVLEHPGLTVDVGDRRAARRGVGVRRVVRHQAEVVLRDLDLPQVHPLDGPVADRKLVRLAGPVVRDRERFLAGPVRYRYCAFGLLLLGHFRSPLLRLLRGLRSVAQSLRLAGAGDAADDRRRNRYDGEYYRDHVGGTHLAIVARKALAAKAEHERQKQRPKEQERATDPEGIHRFGTLPNRWVSVRRDGTHACRRLRQRLAVRATARRPRLARAREGRAAATVRLDRLTLGRHRFGADGFPHDPAEGDDRNFESDHQPDEGPRHLGGCYP